MSDTFEIHGYTIEVYVHNKLKGNYVLEKPDRKVLGYGGRTTHFLETDVVLSNKRVIKAGTKVMTECTPICGRAKIKLNWQTDATKYTSEALLDLIKSNEQFKNLIECKPEWKTIVDFIAGKLKLKTTTKQLDYVKAYYSNKIC